jgi:hypothetical protein
MPDSQTEVYKWKMPITSVGGFLDAVTEIRDCWRPNDDEELWFRGEKEVRDTRLCPQLYRPPKDHTLKSISELLCVEVDLFDYFQRCGAQLCEGTHPEDDWDWYFVMQHYGAPTRILDWSDGALNGLHFALRKTDLAPEKDACVYVLQPYLLLDHLKSLPDYDTTKEKWKIFIQENPSKGFSDDEWDNAYLPDIDDEWSDRVPLPQVPLLWDAAHTMRRFGAQRSRFMIFGTDPLWVQNILEKQDWIRLISIEAKSIPKIRRELRQAGVTESVIFPDLDGLGREVSAIWEERR